MLLAEISRQGWPSHNFLTQMVSGLNNKCIRPSMVNFVMTSQTFRVKVFMKTEKGHVIHEP